MREVDLILRGHSKAQERERARTYEGAALVALAVNNPKKFPKFEEFMGTKKKAQSDPEGLHAFLLGLAMRGK